MLNPNTVKKDFPILSRIIRENKRLIYLDSAATSQKPRVMLDAIQNYYLHHTANVHRGIHVLGDESTKMFYASRTKVAEFFGADADEFILTRNTTEALNGFIYMWAEHHVKKNDVIISTGMEHHSNFVPWQQLAKRKGCTFEVIPVTETGELDLNYLQKVLDGGRVKIVAFVHVSNATGTLNPVEMIARMAKKAGAVTVVDGAQSAPHMPIDFHALGCDAYAFSGHKMLGPMGVGGLIVRKELLKDMEPFLFGGGMINEVSIEETTFADVPDKFIAGTPDVASVVGLAAACDYLTSLGMKDVFTHDVALVRYALEKLQEVKEVTMIGPTDATKRCGSVAFVYDGVHAHDVAQILDSEGIAVRSGHHCTMPLHKQFGWAATTRASFNIYTTKEDIDALISALQKVKAVFKK